MASAHRRDASRVDAAFAAGVIARFAPGWLSEPAAGVVRELVAAAAPDTPARAKALVFAAGRLAAFCDQRGLELSPGVVVAQATVERWVAEGTGGLSGASVRTVRTNLRALARAQERYPPPSAAGLAREHAKRAYGPAEIAGYLRLAGAQSTEARRMRASALICLGAGAGVVAGELRHVRGSDVVARSGGVLVCVTGKRPRSVPVLERYQQRLLEAAQFAGQGLIVGGRAPGRRNISDDLARALSADSSLPRLEPGRLRSTWLTECAQRIGLHAFMQAAGIRCSQRLGDLAAQLPEVGEADLVALLGARA